MRIESLQTLVASIDTFFESLDTVFDFSKPVRYHDVLLLPRFYCNLDMNSLMV